MAWLRDSVYAGKNVEIGDAIENKDGDAKDEPEKRDDHAMDALRYLVRYLDSGLGASGRGVGVARRAERRQERAMERSWKAVG